MRKLLNTLYVTSKGSYLSLDGETVVVRVERETRFRVPLHTLEGIVCFGQVSGSPQLMHACAERAVGMSFVSEYGKFLARVQGPVSGNVLLRREQYRRADEEDRSLEIAGAAVLGKIANSRTVLLRALRDYPKTSGSQEIESAASALSRAVRAVQAAGSLDEVRGLEGEASRHYFAVFDHLIMARKDDFFFHERSRRPPLDRVNSLLSFFYTLLAHDAASACEAVGLDPAVGFLHRDRPGRKGLALDLMEEFRPFLADRLTLSLINRQQIKPEGFTITETGGVLMDEETRKAVLVAYQKRKQEEIQHPFLGEKMAIGLLPFAQAMLLSRFLRGDLDAYPAFIWR